MLRGGRQPGPFFAIHLKQSASICYNVDEEARGASGERVAAPLSLFRRFHAEQGEDTGQDGYAPPQTENSVRGPVPLVPN